MKRSPIIGLISYSKNIPGYSEGFIGNLDSYIYALQASGAIVVQIPALQDTAALQTIFTITDGILLQGGSDIDPKYYHELPHEKLGPISSERDVFEIAVAQMAIQNDKPLFGICRGLQVLNVAAGGTLYQDIPSQISKDINHNQKEDGSNVTHSIRIDSQSRLAQIFQSETAQVNSFHHQSINKLGEGLVVSARAADDVIEAVEIPNRRFILAIQSHPERLFKTNEQSRQLFLEFVAAAGR